MEELETKYLLESGRKRRASLRRLSETLFRAGYLIRPQGSEAVQDVYFDTPEGALYEAGWSLRWRERPGRAQTVTAKRLGAGSNGYFERTELEQSANGLVTLPEALGRGQSRGQVRDLLDALRIDPTSLKSIFSLRNHRTRIALTNQAEYPRALVELSMDEVRISAERPLTFTEFEFEQQQGPPRMLKDLSLVLADQSTLYPARVSKFQRGRLAVGCSTPPQPLPEFTLDEPWLTLCRAHLDRNRETFWFWEAHAWESQHPEGVHQLRVACRKLRSTLVAMEAVVPPLQVQPLIEELRWLTRQLGPLRDLDVHLEWLADIRQQLSKAEVQALRSYQRYLHQQRRRTHSRVRVALGSDRFNDLIGGLNRLAETIETDPHPDRTSIRTVSATLIEAPLKRVLRHGNRIDAESRPEKLHQLRIDLKKLRYRLELITAAMGKRLQPVNQRLNQLQDTLGAHQDARVAAAALRTYRLAQNLSRNEKRLFKQLIQSEQAKVEKKHRKFLKVWQRFVRDSDWLLEPVLGEEDR